MLTALPPKLICINRSALNQGAGTPVPIPSSC